MLSVRAIGTILPAAFGFGASAEMLPSVSNFVYMNESTGVMDRPVLARRAVDIVRAVRMAFAAVVKEVMHFRTAARVRKTVLRDVVPDDFRHRTAGDSLQSVVTPVEGNSSALPVTSAKKSMA